MAQDPDIYDPPYPEQNKVRVEEQRNSNSVLKWLLAAGVGGALCYLLMRKPDATHGNDPLIIVPGVGHHAMWYGGTSGCGTLIGDVEFTTSNSNIPTGSLSHMNTVYVIIDPNTGITYWFDEHLNAYSVVVDEVNGVKRNVVTHYFQYRSDEWKQLMYALMGANSGGNLNIPPDLLPLSLRSLNNDNYTIDETLELGEDTNDYHMVGGKRTFKDYFPVPLYDGSSSRVDWVVGTRTIVWYKLKENSIFGDLTGNRSKFGQIKYEIPYVGTFSCARIGTRAQVKRNSALYHSTRNLQSCMNTCERWSADNSSFILSRHHARRASRQWSSIFGSSEPLHNLRTNMQPYVSNPIDMDLLKTSLIAPTAYTNSMFDAADVRALLDLLKITPNACYWFQPTDVNRANAWLKYMYEHTSDSFHYVEQPRSIGFEWVGLYGQSSVRMSRTVPVAARSVVSDFFHRKGLSVAYQADELSSE